LPRLTILFLSLLLLEYIDILGHRNAELALVEGKLFSSQHAMEIGLVDELVTTAPTEMSKGESMSKVSHFVEKAAIRKAKEFIRIPSNARRATKQWTRKPLIDKLLTERERDIESFCNMITSDQVQKSITNYLENLQKK